MRLRNENHINPARLTEVTMENRRHTHPLKNGIKRAPEFEKKKLDINLLVQSVVNNMRPLAELKDVKMISGEVMIGAAVFFGNTRLIDNITIMVK